MSNKPSNPNHDRGYEDQRQDRFDPPDGTSWTSVISSQIFGSSQADKDYREGWSESKKDK